MILHKLSPLSFLKKCFFYGAFRLLTRKKLNVFLKGGDIISEGPLIDGIYETPLTNFIDKCANNGMSEFLIDIGANIGLTSCQNGNSFKKVYCFEPDPLCVNILKTKLANIKNDDAIIGDVVLMIR